MTSVAKIAAAYRHTQYSVLAKTTLIAVLLLLYPAILIQMGELKPNGYAYFYIWLLVFYVVSCCLVQESLRILPLLMCFYLLIGLLNISSWRGYTTPSVIQYYCWLSYFAVMPMVFVRDRSYGSKPYVADACRTLVTRILAVHVVVTYVAVAYLYAKNGNILLEQHSRFNIPTSLEYIVKSALPAVGVIPLLRLRNDGVWLLAIIAPAVLIGSRGTAVIAILAYLIVSRSSALKHLQLGQSGRSVFVLLVYGLLALVVIYALFYIRRGSGGYSTVDVVLAYYFDYDNVAVRAILPFYLGFKETVGLTTIIISEGVRNTVNEHALFFADLFTVLPGENLAAGQTLSRIFGSVQSGGLTPGLLGGLYIDYGPFALVYAGFLGSAVAVTSRLAITNPLFTVVYAQVVTQFLHLFHRGFLKPEYDTAILIAGFYYFLLTRLMTWGGGVESFWAV